MTLTILEHEEIRRMVVIPIVLSLTGLPEITQATVLLLLKYNPATLTANPRVCSLFVYYILNTFC
jgi:hypothetical protein